MDDVEPVADATEKPDTPRARILAEDQTEAWARSDEVVGLMLRKLWHPGMLQELTAKWGCSQLAARAAQARALYFLARIGERDKVLAEVDEYVQSWVRESGQDRVPAARLLLERMGALRLKHEVTFNVDAIASEEHLDRMRRVLREPSELVAEALRLEGYARINTLDVSGEESE